ncbi:MAG: RagB/SusD family nutrient uptake outer membrane protein, partial [Bacteroidaceae bacterium]|nr:RagB/SusD family nutrient uptake outer membrane protein [Bacteroidaceae bacterium]
MKKTKILIQALLLTVGVAFTSCDDLFEPAIENHLGFEYMYDNPDYADAVLGNAYTRLPNGSYNFSDVATDDAVSNDNNGDNKNTNYYKFRKLNVEGNWKSNNNPLERWRDCRAAIQYINLFLENIDKIKFNRDEKINAMYKKRYTGEAHGLRAIYMYYLLQAHGGYDANGNLLGVPILTNSTNVDT